MPVALAAVLALAGPPSAEAERFFEAKVRPVLAEHCMRCHGPQKQKGGLRLDSGPALLRGGNAGPAVKPGDPDGSLLIRVVRQTGDLKMPPKGKLPPAAVEDLAAWVKMGAPWPSTGEGRGEGTATHWAFRPVTDPALPAVKDAAWAATPLDRFVLAKLEAKGLTPSPPADKRTLIRRVTFDLTGLPPTPEEVEAFVSDPAPDAYEKLIDRLLASPAYGERWGRHWLDVARYADTKGYVFFEENEFPWAWTYRDYVIRAFNDDLPFDRFIREQLAADRLPLGADRRPLTALGFLTVGGRFMNNPHDILDDRIDVVSRGLLGLTVACARCHDHKFDPIPSRDYYALYGVFASSVEPAIPPLFAVPPATEEYRKFAAELEARERKQAEFLAAKRAEVAGGARTRAAEYLLAAHARRGQPSAEEFMLIADGTDLNPAMLTRWQAFLDRTRRHHHPVFAPWHALADLPEQGFADRARDILSRLAADREHRVNPLVIGALTANPPKSLAEVARAYGALLNKADRMGRE
jgi:cytochrome c553